MTTIAVALFDAVEELDFAGPWEVLSVWARTWPGDEVNLFTVAESSEPVTCAKASVSCPSAPGTGSAPSTSSSTPAGAGS
jgi:hypothetical protein